jgi:hypothetical protein
VGDYPSCKVSDLSNIRILEPLTNGFCPLGVGISRV